MLTSQPSKTVTSCMVHSLGVWTSIRPNQPRASRSLGPLICGCVLHHFHPWSSSPKRRYL